MKVLFANPPWWDITDKEVRAGVRAGSRWPFTQLVRSRPDQFVAGDYTPYPFFMGYAASYAAKHTDFEVRFRDSIALKESYASFIDYMNAERPDYIVLEMWTSCRDHDTELIRGIHKFWPKLKIIITGPICITKSKEILETLPVVATIKGEYEKGVVRVLKGETGDIGFDLLTGEEMNAAPFAYMDHMHAYRYFDSCPRGVQFPHAHVWSSRGCVFKCLAGDTPVNTVRGMIPIKELAETGNEIGVFTYDPIERRAKVATAKNIQKTGENRKLVRVNFDDGTHIDCTPDHRFLTFKWGNQFTGEKESVVEAKDLKPGTHLRALKTYFSGLIKSQYLSCAWSRKGREKTHRMIAEWFCGRRLLDGEIVHHIDGNKLNNLPENLKIVSSHKEHFSLHPEISERMKKNNPTKNGVSVEWREKLSKSLRGKVRSEESRQRYREAAIKREELHRLRRSENGIVNHRVVSVVPLPGLHDVYCMEVPETNWFYANNVLVHNCEFCITPGSMTNDDPDGQKTRKMRFYTKDYMEAYLKDFVVRFDYKSIYFDDDTMNMGNKHTLAMCEVMDKIKLPWAAMCRVDTVNRDTWKAMKKAGCYGVKLGFESGSQYVVDKIVRKGLDLEEARDTVFFLRSIGMQVHGTFTYGHPGETPEQRQMTLKYRNSLPLTSYQESGVAEMDGSPLAEMRKGALKGYEGATMDEGYVRNSDGVKKIESMIKELQSQ